MKIVKGLGERLPSWLHTEVRPILTFTGAGTTLAAGSIELATRAWQQLSDRLTPWERLGALAAAGYLAAYGCAHAPQVAPFVIPGAAVAWCVAAWWIAPPAAVEPEPSTHTSGPTDTLVPWLLHLMGDRPGIHLRDLYPAMRQLPGHEDRSNAELRAALRTLGIPVERTLRLGLVAGRSGVARAALEALPSPVGESGGEIGGDAGQPTDSPAGEPSVERLESA